jgi:hypothetical protein
MSIITKTNCRITFLEETTIEEVSNIVALVDAANEMISRFLGAESKFDIIVCKSSWDMEVQVISREKSVKPYKDGVSLVGLTDYELKEIIIIIMNLTSLLILGLLEYSFTHRDINNRGWPEESSNSKSRSCHLHQRP